MKINYMIILTPADSLVVYTEMCIMYMLWVCNHLNAILFDSWQSLRSFYFFSSIDLAGAAVSLSDSMKTLGVNMDSRPKLTFRRHITCLVSNYHG